MNSDLLSFLDYSIIIGFFIISLIIGLAVSKSSGNSSEDFFLSGRKMPWWLLGVSMVATTFAADTPGLVTQLVRGEGVSKNWVWWYMLLTGTLTVFFFAKLWRKSGVTTDLEFYELRYSGRSAAFLRGFRAVYLGFFLNVMIMANVCLAGAKISAVMFGVDQMTFLCIAGGVTVIYSMLGGLKGVLITDFFQFIIAMIGSVWATYYIVGLPEVGGMENIMNVVGEAKLSILPDFSDSNMVFTLLIIPLSVFWWSTWYPGAEPGGGGYIVQRMLAAKDEKHATYATLFFNFAHYALRPWPWIVIGLASIVVFPNLESIQATFSNVDPSLIKDDAAYSAMLTFLPSGLIGIVVASLIAAFMSTISTQLNWGSSYMVNDIYKRFIKPDAPDKDLVNKGRWSTLILMVCAGAMSFAMSSAQQFFEFMMVVGAGTGLLYILRWFWKRINPYSEIVAIVVSFVIALSFLIYNNSQEVATDKISSTTQILLNILITTIGWVSTSLLTNPSKEEVLKSFDEKIFSETKEDGTVVIDKFHNFGYKILAFIMSSIGIYSALFATGYFIYGQISIALICTGISILGMATLVAFRKKIFS